jgi:hypothetical protein
VLRKGGRLIIQEVNLSLLLRFLFQITKHEGYSYNFDVFNGSTKCNDPGDPWSSNNAIQNLLFDDIERFENNFNFKIIYNQYSECIIWPLSGGVASVIASVTIPGAILKIIEKVDNLLILFSKNIFALQRKIVLKNAK